MVVKLGSPRRPAPSWLRWTLACGAAETVGMAVAAGTAVALRIVVGEPRDWPTGLAVWAGSIAGGAVEGLAVGVAQAAVLRRWLPRLPVGRWLRATLAVTVVCWALGMAAPALVVWQVRPDAGPAGGAGSAAAAGADAGPPLPLTITAGVLGGLVLGAIFGAVQARVLRGHVARPRRWVTANAVGWAAAMGVIMTGASIPGADWPVGRILLLGAATGILAGLVIGAVTGAFLPALDGDAP